MDNIIDLDDYRKEGEQIIFEDEDTFVDFFYTWLESIMTEKEIMIIAQRLERLNGEI